MKDYAFKCRCGRIENYPPEIKGLIASMGDSTFAMLSGHTWRGELEMRGGQVMANLLSAMPEQVSSGWVVAMAGSIFRTLHGFLAIVANVQVTHAKLLYVCRTRSQDDHDTTPREAATDDGLLPALMAFTATVAASLGSEAGAMNWAVLDIERLTIC